MWRRRRYVAEATMNPSDALWRFALAVVATAVALRIAWSITRPLLPTIAVIVGAAVIWRIACWYRGRW